MERGAAEGVTGAGVSQPLHKGGVQDVSVGLGEAVRLEPFPT